MIPNFAPMAAVFLKLSGSTLFSRPVAAWSEHANAMIEYEASLTVLNESLLPDAELMGIFPGTWTPSYDEMSSLLPPRAPGEPDLLTTRVILVELTSGTWEARRVHDRACVISAFSFADLERKLAAIGCFHIEKVIPLGDDT